MKNLKMDRIGENICKAHRAYKGFNSRTYVEFLYTEKKAYNSVLKMGKRFAHKNINWLNYFRKDVSLFLNGSCILIILQKA